MLNGEGKCFHLKDLDVLLLCHAFFSHRLEVYVHRRRADFS